ncbi:MAG: hypothetical protein ACJ0G4_01425 [Alphaproteobacteria bacterium]
MLSLSIFTSSQTISVALYKNRRLIKFLKKKIYDNKIDDIFVLLKELLSKDRSYITKIFFSVGPASYTALRSIKSIAEGISAVTNAKVVKLTEFEIYLANFKIYRPNLIVFYENINGIFFYQHFKASDKIYSTPSRFYHGDITKIKKFILKKSNKKIEVISSSQKSLSLIKKSLNVTVHHLNPCSRKLAEAAFQGYGKIDRDIVYHHTYYE